MDIDTREATERLTRELGPTAPRRRPVVVVLVACAVVVAALLAWSNRDDERRDIGPVDDRESSSPEVPYYLDLADGAQTPAPPSAAALSDASANVAFSPAGDRVVYGTCLIGAGRCFSDDQLFLANADGTDQRTLNPPAGLNAYFPDLVAGRDEAGLPGAPGRCRRRRQPLPPRPRHGRADPADRSRPGAADVVAGDLGLQPRRRTSRLLGARATRSWRRSGTSGRCRLPAANPPGCSRTRTLPSTSPTAESPSSGRVRDDSPDTLLAAAPGGEPEVLVEYEAEDGTAASPDGTRIAYLDDGCPAPVRSRQRRSETPWRRRSVRLGRRRPAPGRPRPRAAVVPGPDHCGPFRPLACHPAWDVCFCLPK